MTELKPQPAELVMTLEITRAATGKTETVQVICTPVEPKENQDGSNSLNDLS